MAMNAYHDISVLLRFKNKIKGTKRTTHYGYAFNYYSYSVSRKETNVGTVIK